MSATAESRNSLRRSAPRTGIERRRLLISATGWVLCGVAFLLVAVPLIDLVGVVTVKGAMAFKPSLFTHTTVGHNGGLLNAIIGTLVLSLGSLVFAVPVGVGAGMYLSEYGHGWLGAWIRFLSDTLTGVPSIVLGYFSYITLVIGLGWKFSAVAGSITLAIMIVPYIARITEDSLRRVPNSMREAGYALGARDQTVAFRLVLSAGFPGVLTGILLALAISVGETAPLIYTAGWSTRIWQGNLTHEPIGYLTYVIWTFINDPSEHAHALAFAAALLVMMIVLAINIGVRIVLRRKPI